MTTASPTHCCIVGGGPAGVMLGYLLARNGARVTVLEKHADFLRDFRGDTVHPSTLRILDELGLLDRFLLRPHQKLTRLQGWFGDRQVQIGDFTGLPPRYAFIALMPQWDFLDFLAGEARTLAGFELRMRSRVDALLFGENNKVIGVSGHDDNGAFELKADCVIGCDGRHSTVRDAAGLAVENVGAPIDVLWFRISREAGLDDTSLARIAAGRFLVTLDRGDYWQCAFVIAKGGAAALQAQDITMFRQQVRDVAPFLAPHLEEIRSWDDVKLLSVSIDRLLRWSRPGLLCIGDAAHAMSPVGGVGINLAIQDAVATANLLAGKLRERSVTADDLDAVRRRRLWPTRVTQAMQTAIQTNVLVPAITGRTMPDIPLPLRMVSNTPALQRMLARVIGLGVRPEHVRTT